MTSAIQIIGQQVPDDFAQTLRDVRRDRPERLSHLLRIANEAGWTLTALAEPLGVTCEAVRIRVKRSGEPRNLPAPAVEIPSPPPRQKTKTETEQEAAAERARNRKLQPCGTHAAYERHRRRRETICDACSESSRQVADARTKAYRRLIELHPAEFRELRAEFEPSGNRWNLAAQALSRAFPEEFVALHAAVKAGAV